MAQRLLNAGHDLRVYNRTRSKATILREAGARDELKALLIAAGAEEPGRPAATGRGLASEAGLSSGTGLSSKPGRDKN